MHTDQANDDEGTASPESARHKAQAQTFLTTPALLPREDRAEYDSLLADLTECIKPEDFIEKTWLRDVAHHEWSSKRYRNMLAQQLMLAEQEGIQSVMARLTGNIQYELAREYMLKQARALGKVAQLLNQAGLNLDSVRAEAFAKRMQEIGRLDQLARQAETYRDKLLRDIERRRAAAAERFRRGLQQTRPTLVPQQQEKQAA